MPVWLPHIVLSLLAGALAIAGLNLAFPAEIARAIGGVSFAALLANLSGTASAARGMPVLTAFRIQWTMACAIARGLCTDTDGVMGGRARVALMVNTVVAVLSLPSLIRLLKWAAGAS